MSRRISCPCPLLFKPSFETLIQYLVTVSYCTLLRSYSSSYLSGAASDCDCRVERRHAYASTVPAGQHMQCIFRRQCLALLATLFSASTADRSQELARHEAVFTRFCDHGLVADGTCVCKGGSATAAIGDGSWLWSELVGKPCAAQSNDRCDCTNCGGGHSQCPHEGCWQCEGINAPQCNPSDALKRCEVAVHGTHGMEKFYFTEVCPSQHPCNRCKDPRLQRCAARSPLAVDLCGTTWSNVFEKSRSEATGFVTLSCYPHAYRGEPTASSSSAMVAGTAAVGDTLGESSRAPVCVSSLEGDVQHAVCEDWCSAANAADHCRWCKCRACERMAGACDAIIAESEKALRKRAALHEACGAKWDCLSWCNQGNCGDCRCAACERCGPEPPKRWFPSQTPSPTLPPKAVAPATATSPSVNAIVQPAGCHGWCIAGGDEDPEIVCQSSKCQACPICQSRRSSFYKPK